MKHSSRVEVLETISLELLVYLNMLFSEWLNQVPALRSLVLSKDEVDDDEEYFRLSDCHVHDSEKSEHVWFEGPLAGFQVSAELDEDEEIALYTLRYCRDGKKVTHRFADIRELGQKIAMLAFGHAGKAFVDCETKIFKTDD